MKAARIVAAALAGFVFGAGLQVAQMTDPRKVQNFLDVAGAWDPSLLFVLGGAVIVAAAGFALARGRARPWFDERFHGPAARRIDRPLLLGSALFGIGWALAGFCPGPAIASLGFASTDALLLVPAMLAGAWLQRRTAAAPPGPAPEAQRG